MKYYVILTKKSYKNNNNNKTRKQNKKKEKKNFSTWSLDILWSTNINKNETPKEKEFSRRDQGYSCDKSEEWFQNLGQTNTQI